MARRILLFYQTLVDLGPILASPDAVTDIHLAAIHFGVDQGEAYIHLNDYWPDDKRFDKPWAQLEAAAKAGIRISLLIGGAGGAFGALFNDYDEYFSMLVMLLEDKPFITGINLDVEEYVKLENLQKLIRDLYARGLEISMSPLASSLASDGPGMGGFSYKDLGKTPEGAMVSYLCGQFYGEISDDAAQYLAAVTNGYRPSSIVLGSLGPLDKDQMKTLQTQIDILSNRYPRTFGGIFLWEYSLQPSFPFWIHVPGSLKVLK